MKPSSEHLLASDLDDILSRTAGVWERLEGARIFLTGGTGFIGTWLIESLVWAKKRYELDLNVTVLTRDPVSFASRSPHLVQAKGLDFLEGDVRDFKFPDSNYSHVIHAATAASAKLNLEQPYEMLSTIVDGGKHVLEFAARCGAKSVMQTSTGGVYGRQPPDMVSVSEDYLGAPDPMDPYAAYSEGKRLSEMMGRLGSDKYGYDHKVARITALVGPLLPMDKHYAIGNFIRDAICGGPIKILGDGTPVRSYMYIADLVAWLWVILDRGISNRPYNAGSDVGISILDTAETVRRVSGRSFEIIVENQNLRDGRPSRYVPSVQRAKNELGLKQWTDLEFALRKTFNWCRLVSAV